MIDIGKHIRRVSAYFWQGVTEENVLRYQADLGNAIEELDAVTWNQKQLLSIKNNDIKEGVLGILKDELDLCHFYFEYNQRQEEENFDRWFFVKQEDRKTVLNEPDWVRVEGDCWIRYNGKTRAIITIDESGTMTKISLCLDNDAVALRFLDHSIDIASSHLKNRESIKQRIAKYKALAEEKMEEYKYPRYCSELNEFAVLKGLLHVEEVSRG